jgi:hypothetical protein
MANTTRICALQKKKKKKKKGIKIHCRAKTFGIVQE